ncbi:MAG: LytTR family DNA-binding domain-containing protein [Bacteroidetes bacterium]|nr:LytTR family DNA-binding domain-containing protein [Bacteroidota bacterium]
MIRCIAIDDEALALDLLEDNISKIPFLELAGRYTNAFDALKLMREKPVDLLFLDIQMPDITGIQFLKSLQQKPLVIFTTAFSKYALEGFELDVIDYLLKPYSFERFLKAVNKAHEFLELQERAKEAKKGPAFGSHYLFVRADYKLVKIDIQEILYIEGLKDYVKIYCGEKPVLTQMSMKAIEEKLPTHDFIRVHRSFIVAFDKIDFIHKSFISIKGREIPLSDNYKDNFLSLVQKNKIME